jgi:hypothetical protein
MKNRIALIYVNNSTIHKYKFDNELKLWLFVREEKCSGNDVLNVK